MMDQIQDVKMQSARQRHVCVRDLPKVVRESARLVVELATAGSRCSALTITPPSHSGLCNANPPRPLLATKLDIFI